MLTFSRQAGAAKEPCHLHTLVREVLILLRASLPASIEIVDNVDPGSGVVLANGTQLHQVAMNICTNAAQAMEESGGRLEVWVADADLSEEFASRHPNLQAGPYVMLSVRDTGHGIKAQIKDRIFDPFFTTKGPGEGTGMGLSVTHGIVADHGGAILVESVPGHGATFHAYFPRIEDVVLEEHAAESADPAKGERILLVDDEHAILFFGKEALTQYGYEVDLCADGASALERFLKHPDKYDLVITDQSMPNMTGEQLIRKIREVRPELPIILFTGFGDIHLEQWVEELNVSEVITKPAIAQDLSRVIRAVLDK